MFKFQFTRLEEPKVPTWNCKSTSWPLKNIPDGIRTCYLKMFPYFANLGMDCRLFPLWIHVWNWLCGKPNNPENSQHDCFTKVDNVIIVPKDNEIDFLVVRRFSKPRCMTHLRNLML